VLASVFQAT